MNIPKTPRQRMKEGALDQKKEIENIAQFHRDKDDGKTNMAPDWKPGQFERIFRGNHEIQSN